MINKLLSIVKYLMLGTPTLILVAILQIIAIIFSVGTSIFITKFLIIETPTGNSIIPVGLGALAFGFLSVAGISKITKTDIVLDYPVSYYFMAKGKSEPKSVKENIKLFLKLSRLFFVLYLISCIVYLLVF